MVRSTLVRRLMPAVVFLCAAFVVIQAGLKDGEDLLIQRKYKAAAAHLKQALADGVPAADRDRAMLLLGRAQWLSKDVAGAVATYRRLQEQLPGSPLIHKARFQRAEALASIGDFRAAAPIYQAEIERLVGLSRKEEVAATYLGLAEKARNASKPDHNRAVAFFDLALDLGLSADKARSVRLLAAEARLAARNYGDAQRRFAPLTKSLKISEGKLRAMIGLGRARWRGGNRSGARTTLRDLIQLAPKSAEAADAAYEIALTYGVPKPGASNLDRAVAALRRLHERYPAHKYSKVAWYLTARCYGSAGRSEDALRSLREFLAEDRADLDEIPLARAMVGDVLAGQGKRTEAIVAWRSFLKSHPSHRDWERVQRAIVDADYGRAMDLYQRGKTAKGTPRKNLHAEARKQLQTFARNYPIDARNPEILYLFGEILFLAGDYKESRDAFVGCVSKYPRSNSASHAQFRIGEIFETKIFNYQNALDAYRLVKTGSWRSRAAQRIQRLTRKSMALFTPRSYRTGEKATFKLTSRNIEKVRVRVFKLDMETYFRASHTAGGVDRLDIEVIEPDKLFESVVPEYIKHRETERELDITFDDPGAYVVKVDDREFEATTMVMVSDVGVIAKSSRHEVFVFTQNLKEQRVESGVKVMLSDGKKIIAEGSTGADGVWRYKGPELRSTDQLRVFAVNSAGSGASSLSLSGLGYSQGLTPKCYLFTDRPVYQPGHRVHIKGIAREVAGGLYKLPAAAGYHLQVLNSAGRMILQRAIEFTGFGAFTADLRLPRDAALGKWRVRVYRKNGRAFSGEFEVARYQRPRVRLAAEPKSRVVYRGEKIEGVFKLDYFFGEPAVGKTIHYSLHLPDGGLVERQGKTGANGEVEFSFDTKEFGEEAMAVIRARVAEENAATQLVVPVVTTEFTPSLSLVRAVYLAGEPFDVTVGIKDRSGKPLARPGTARLLRREVHNGVVTEVEVDKKSFQTAASGQGRIGFKAEKGGAYTVRVEAKDRFGSIVTAQTSLQISGEDDAIKLRLLSDREHFKVGETLRVKVANRSGARLVLRTVQGDGILSYRSQVLPAGESVIEFELQPSHAPNFGLALAMIDGQQLRTAQREFRVSRDLQITVRPKQATARPGEAVEVEVITRDPKGRPVAAEVALALVDESLLTLHPDRLPGLGTFFFGVMRQTTFRTVSSCTWSYRGAAHRMSAELLAEEQRERLVRDAEDDRKRVRTGSDDFFLGGTRRVSGRQPASGGPASSGANSRAVLDRRIQELGTGNTGIQSRLKADHKGLLSLAERADRSQFKGYYKFDWAEYSALNNGIGLQGGAFDPGQESRHQLDQPRKNFAETGAWVPTLRTGADGKGTVTLHLPHSTTSYKLTARGVTRDTYVGEGTASLRARKDLQAGVILPFALVEGDKARVTASVHNLTKSATNVTLGFSVSQSDATEREEARMRLAAQREGSHVFDLAPIGDQDLRVRLEAKAGGLSDTVERVVPVQPFGAEFRDGTAGYTSGTVSFTLSLPKVRKYKRLEMLIEIGRDPGDDLVRAALGLGFRPNCSRRVDLTNLSVSSRGFSALLVLDYLERAGRSTPADATRLRQQAASSLSGLVASQVKDGGVPWIGRRTADFRSTCQAILFLSLASRRGFEAARPALDKAAEWTLQRMRRARLEDRVQAAWALASMPDKRIGYSTLNALHRSRAGMSSRSLAHLALAWQAFGRAELAGEVIAVLKRNSAVVGVPSRPTSTETETRALVAAALLRAAPRDAMGSKLIAWLVERQVGIGWGTPSVTAAALRALVVAGGREMASASSAEVKVEVNDRLLATVPASIKDAKTRFLVPSAWLKSPVNKVRITVTGRGKVHYSALLNGFGEGFGPVDRPLGSPEREYYPAYRRHQGKVLQPGFTVLTGKFKSFHNKLTRLAVGESGRVQVRYRVLDSQRKWMTPLVMEESIPAGCTVRRESVTGNFDHVVVEPNRMTFYFRENVYNCSINYELHARIPGSYRVLPTRVYGARRPDLITHGKEQVFSVLPRGSEDRDPYRLTPNELYSLGKQLFDGGELTAAGRHLDQLLADWHKIRFQLRDDTYKQVARMMLFISVARTDSKSIVKFFEVLKDQYPDLVIPFDKIVAVGKAYRDIGEDEQSLMVFRAAAESSFLKEAAVANVLETMGEVRASVRFLRNLLLSYPDLNTMRIGLYSIGQKLAALAAGMPDGAKVNPKVGKREVLRAAGNSIFREFLVMYPEDPLAEEVSFAWATTCVEGKDLDAALAVALSALERYPNSTFTDELLYTVGFAQFAKGQHSAAFATLKRVANDSFQRPGGGSGPSENKFHAIYLQGQIHHARGEPAKALAAYELVQKYFSDATEASDYFQRKSISLPEVTRFAIGKKVSVKLDYRNIKAVDVKVYRVDLMRLYILQKSLNNIRGIKLHGIRPFAETRAELGDGRDYRSKEKVLSLDLKDAGAYLVVVRGGDLLATGMVLCSDLKIEAQEFLDVGRIRVNVKGKAGYLSDAHVKVVGSDDQRFRSGATDLRGIFVGTSLVGQATVIVKKDNHYAFYRGAGVHQPQRVRPKPQARPKSTRGGRAQGQNKKAAEKAFKAWDNNMRSNGFNRARQIRWLDKEILKNKQTGVEVYRTK